MGKQYQQVTFEERCEISRLRASGLSVRQIAASLDRAPSTVSRELNRNGSRTQGTGPAMHSSKSGLGAGAALGWNGMTRCVVSSCLGSSRDGRRSRWRAAWRWKLAPRSSPMRASTASYTGRWLARRTTPDATTCPVPSPNGAGEVVEAAVRRRSFSCAGPWPSVPRMRRIALPRDIGRLT